MLLNCHSDIKLIIKIAVKISVFVLIAVLAEHINISPRERKTRVQSPAYTLKLFKPSQKMYPYLYSICLALVRR